MPFQPNDVLLAFKHIGMLDQLNGTEKQFACFLVDSFNRRTGRCDPSEETAAHVLKKSSRSIIRAGNRLINKRLFRKTKHGGNNHCNSYEPVWETFRELERDYKLRRKRWAERFARPKVSPLTGQPSHSEHDSQDQSECRLRHTQPDDSGTQTYPYNHIEGTCPKQQLPSTLAKRPQDKPSIHGNGGRPGNEASYRDSSNHSRGMERVHSAMAAAEAAAVRRWSDDILRHFPSLSAYSAAVDAIDLPMQEAATAAEMKQRGGGLAFIVSELSRREKSQDDGADVDAGNSHPEQPPA